MRRRERRVDASAELDVTPVMSLIVHLIPMLLLSVRFASFGQLPASGPVVPTREAVSQGRFEQQSRQVVSVRVTPQGFVLGGVGDLDPRLPCKGACDVGTYDYEGLNVAMIEAKRLHPQEQRVVIAPEASVPFDVVVRVMDATRDASSAGGTRVSLFPQPLLASPAAEAP
jgi:biopolymer transport protein ExbD